VTLLVPAEMVGQLTVEIDQYRNGIQLAGPDLVGSATEPLPYFEQTVGLPDGEVVVIGAVLEPDATEASMYFGQSRGDTFVARGGRLPLDGVAVATPFLGELFDQGLGERDATRDLLLTVTPVILDPEP
jgi:hypothetical protein